MVAEHRRMSSIAPALRNRVLIVGGGVAALESVLALHELAAESVTVTLLAPEPAFALRSHDVARPFARAQAAELDLEQFMLDHGGRFRRTAALAFAPRDRVVRCATGWLEHYDTLVVAVGAPTRPAFAGALSFGADPLPLAGLLADLEDGYTKRIAFVVPESCAWTLPLYELVLMTAEETWGMGIDDAELHLVTSEPSPLVAFGATASAGVAALLAQARVVVHCGERASVRSGGRVELASGELLVERVVALPVLDGPRLEGLPCDADGFLPVDDHGRVRGVARVYAVGDAADHAVKQGGLACQQADAAAAAIAAESGAGCATPPFVPVLRGRLLTGHHDRFLRLENGVSEISGEPLWQPPMKIAGRLLAPFLEARGLATLPLRAAPAA
jgi:sulfide:quinone oxidoreductase